MFDPTKISKGKNPMAKKPAKTTAEEAKAGKGHNGTGLDEGQEKVFIREFAALKAAETEMAGTKGEMGGSYKRLEQAGFTKEHIKWAHTLEKSNVAEIIRDLRMKISIAKLMGHAAGRQLDLIDDRTPLEDQAYLEGLAAGKLGRDASNPYGMETTAGQSWQSGMNDGNVVRNAALNEAINGAAPSADLIKGPGETETSSSDDGDGSGSDDNEGDAGISDGDQADDTTSSGTAESGGEQAALEGEIIPPAGAADEDDWDGAAPAKTVKTKK